MKKTSYIVMVILLIISMVFPNAYAANDQKSASDVVREYIGYIDEQDWDGYINISSERDRSDLTDFVTSKDNQAQNLGILTVTNAKVQDILPIDPQEIPQVMLADDGEDTQAFIVTIDMTVKEETKYFYNGLNIFTILMVKETNGWTVRNMSSPTYSLVRDELQKQISKRSMSSDLSTALAILENRNLNSVFINMEGEVILDNRMTEQEKEALEDQGLILDNPNTMGPRTTGDYTIRAARGYYDPPSTVRVAMYNKNGVRTGIYTVTWYDFIKNSLPNEWGQNWNLNSLRAGAMCIKMLVWSVINDPWYPNSGFDVKNNNEAHYLPNTETAYTTQAINEIGGEGMFNYEGYTFYPSYAAGAKNSYGNQYSGIVSQWGTQKWATEGQYYYAILGYYYSYSMKSPNGPIQFWYY